MNQWKPYLISLAVGFLVGIEREKANPDQKALGVRTFILLGLLGAISGGLQNPWQSALISCFIFSLILSSYLLQKNLNSKEIHLGLTTEIAGGIVFAAGYLTHDSPVLAATVGPIVAMVLFSKITLHRFTHSIKSDELKAAIMILLVAAIVVELTPDSTIDPWGFFNPRKFGYLALTLASLEFLSYISYKVIGEKKSSLVIGLLGGIVSSTVVLISSAKQAGKKDTVWQSLAITAIASQFASLCELLLIIFLVSSTLAIQFLYIVLPLIMICGIAIMLLSHKMQTQGSSVELKSPLDWKGVFRLSVLFTFVLVLISATEHWLGKEASLAVSFLTGLFELQGISLANSTLFNQNQIGLKAATECISIAVIASLLSKLIISWFFGRNKFSACMTAVFFPMIVMVILVTYWILSLN